jgi:hypothetical protein
MSTRYGALALALLLTSCSEKTKPEPQPAPEPEASANPCAGLRVTGRIPRILHEASGVTFGLAQPDLLWVLADDGPPVIFALDSTGSVRAQVLVRNARNKDWESIASARCAAGNCLYIGDIGDNLRQRNSVRIYRVPEPRLGQESVTADIFELRYPDTPHDAEALFVLPDEQVYVVTKGRSEPITVYRYPGPLRRDSVVTLEPVQQLSASFVQLPDMVTGAGSTPDGKTIVLRTYSSLQLYHLENGQLVPQLPGRGVSLEPLHESQGEGVDISSDGTIVLVSEQGLDEGLAPLSRLKCPLTSAR